MMNTVIIVLLLLVDLEELMLMVLVLFQEVLMQGLVSITHNHSHSNFLGQFCPMGGRCNEINPM